MCGIILNKWLIVRQSEEGCKRDLIYVALLISAKSPHSEVLSIHSVLWNSKPGSDQAAVAAAKPNLCCSIPCHGSLSEGDGDSLETIIQNKFSISEK